MKIKNLIAILQQFDNDADVTIFRQYYHGVDEIEFDQVPAIFADVHGDCLIIPTADKWHAGEIIHLQMDKPFAKNPFYIEIGDAAK